MMFLVFLIVWHLVLLCDVF